MAAAVRTASAHQQRHPFRWSLIVTCSAIVLNSTVRCFDGRIDCLEQPGWKDDLIVTGVILMGMFGFAAIVLHFTIAGQDFTFHLKAERVLSFLCWLGSTPLVCFSMGYINNEAIGSYPSFIAALRPANLYFGSWSVAIASLHLLVTTYLDVDHQWWAFALAANLVVTWSTGKLHSSCVQDNSLDDDDGAFPNFSASIMDDDDILSDNSTTCHHVLVSLSLALITCIFSLVALGMLTFVSNWFPQKVQAGVSTGLVLIGIAQVGASSFGAGPATMNYQHFDDTETVFVTNLFFSAWMSLFTVIFLWAGQLQKIGLIWQSQRFDNSKGHIMVRRWSSWVAMMGSLMVILAIHETNILHNNGKENRQSIWTVTTLLIISIVIGASVAIGAFISHPSLRFIWKGEIVLATICSGTLCALLRFIMDPDASFAQARVIPFAPHFGGKTIMDEKVYFLSWGAFLLTLNLTLSHLKACLPCIFVAYEGWFVLLIPSIVLVSCGSLFFREGGSACLTNHCKQGYWQYTLLLAVGLLSIVASLVLILFGKLKEQRQHRCQFGTSVCVFILCSVEFGLITFREENAIVSQHFSYPGTVYFATLGCFGTSLFLLSKHASMLFVHKETNLSEHGDTIEDDISISHEDEAQVIPMEGFSI